MAEDGDRRKEGEHDFWVPRIPSEAPPHGHPSLALTVSAERFVCAARTRGGDAEDHKGALTIDKRTYAFAVDAAAVRPEFSHTITVAAVLGVIQRRQEAFLAVATEAVCVGTVCGGKVYGVRGAALLPFELQVSLAQRSRSGAVAREVRSLEHALSSGGFYFSYDVDLSGPLGAPARGGHEAGAPDAQFSDDFCWNREMSEELRALPPPYDREWAVPLIHGSVQAEQVRLGDDTALPPLLRNRSAAVALIARRSRLRSWPRTAVGLDEEGCSAGLVSTHLLLRLDSGTHEAPPVDTSLQIVLGSCPLVWEKVGERLCIQAEASCRDVLLRHVRQLRPQGPATKQPGQDPEHRGVALVSVHAADAQTTDDLALERALDTAVALAASMLQQEAESRGPPCRLTKVAAKLKETLAWSDLQPHSCAGAVIEQVRNSLRKDNFSAGPGWGVARGGGAHGWHEREQLVVWRLHPAHASTDEAMHTLSLGCVALALGLIGLENLFSEVQGYVAARRWKAGAGGALEQAIGSLWQHATANLYRQVADEEPPCDAHPAARSGLASRLSGLTGGRASWLVRRAAAGVSTATQAISSLARAPAPESHGVPLLALTRTAASLEARRRWRRHGRICAVEDALWEQRAVRIMCGSWNTKGKVCDSSSFVAWFSAALERWGAEGAEVYAIGLQEGVELGAVNLLKDAGSVFADALDLDPDSPHQHCAHADDGASAASAAGGKALQAWQAEITTAIQHVFRAEGRVEVVAARQLVGVMLFVLVRSSIRKLVSNVAVQACRTGLGGITGNKGAVAVRLQLAYTTVAFVSVHMCAHTKNVAQRNREYESIGNMAVGAPADAPCYPERMQEAIKQQRSAAPAHLLAQDVLVFMGDLNYRIDGIADGEVLERIAARDLHHLARFDQLLRERRAGKVLWGLQEAPLSFAPTYKFASDSEEYSDGGKGRVPAWTDRILFRGRGVQCLDYTSCMQVRGSDHKPVVALLQLDAKMGARGEASEVLLQQLQQEQQALHHHLLRLANLHQPAGTRSSAPPAPARAAQAAHAEQAAAQAAAQAADGVFPGAGLSGGGSSLLDLGHSTSLIDLSGSGGCHLQDCSRAPPAQESKPSERKESERVSAAAPALAADAAQPVWESFASEQGAHGTGGNGQSSNGGQGAACDPFDPFEDAMPVAGAGGGAGTGGKSGMMEDLNDLFGLDFSALPPTPEQMNIAADLKLSASPSACNAGQSDKSKARVQQAMQLSVAALMVPHNNTAKNPGAAPPGTSNASQTQAPGQQADPFARLFQ